MANKKSGEMPFTQQRRYSGTGVDTQPSNAIPRCTEYDLHFTPSRTRTGVWGDEQTHTVGRRGNKVTEGGNF